MSTDDIASFEDNYALSVCLYKSWVLACEAYAVAKTLGPEEFAHERKMRLEWAQRSLARWRNYRSTIFDPHGRTMPHDHLWLVNEAQQQIDAWTDEVEA